jgi:hypothetical protein
MKSATIVSLLFGALFGKLLRLTLKSNICSYFFIISCIVLLIADHAMALECYECTACSSVDDSITKKNCSEMVEAGEYSCHVRVYLNKIFLFKFNKT